MAAAGDDLFDPRAAVAPIDVDMRRRRLAALAEAVVFGRAAMGETVQQGALHRPLAHPPAAGWSFAETLRLDGAIADEARKRAVARAHARSRRSLMVPG